MRRVALFELRQQLSGHVFWVVFAISAMMALGSVGIDALRVGTAVAGLRNGAAAIVQTHLVWSLFFMFTTAAFVADAVLRDELVGFAPIVRAAPVRWHELVYGRFAGAFAAVILCFAGVPLGILAGSAMPWVDGLSVGPIRPDAYLFAFLVMAVPNLLLSASLGFVLATLGRSLGAALVGAVVLLMLYGLGARSGAVLPPLVEPFGFAAYADAVRGWNQQMRDAALPAFNGELLANRLLAVATSLLLLAVTALRFAPRDRAPAKVDESLDEGEPATPPRLRGPLRPSFTGQFRARLLLEVRQIVRTPVFAALLILGVANAVAALWPDRHTNDPRIVVRTLSQAFQLAPIVVALFFSGELRWMERERGISALLGATPLAQPAFLLPKFAAIAVVLVAMTGVTALSAALAITGAGGTAAAALLPDWFGVACYNALVFAALAMFLQAIAANKIAGWGFTVLFLVATLALDRLGLVAPIYRYGRYPGWPLPSSVSGVPWVWPYQVYWGAVAALLLAVAAAIAKPEGRRSERPGP